MAIRKCSQGRTPASILCRKNDRVKGRAQYNTWKLRYFGSASGDEGSRRARGQAEHGGRSRNVAFVIGRKGTRDSCGRLAWAFSPPTLNGSSAARSRGG